MRSKLIPLLLILSLVSCTNTDNDPNNENIENQTVSQEEVKEAETETNTADNSDESSNEETNTNDENTIAKEDTNASQAQSRSEQIASIKQEAIDLYEEIKKEPPYLSIDGSETNLDFKNNLSKDIVVKLGFEIISSEPSPNEYYTNSIYKTPLGNKIKITTGDDASSMNISEFHNAEIILPYGVTASDTADEVRQKLGKFSLRDKVDEPYIENGQDFVSFATENIGYSLAYENNELISIDIVGQDDEFILQTIRANLGGRLPEDKQAILVIEGNEFSFPIKYDELAEKLDATIIEATSENINEFLDQDLELDESGMEYYLEDKLILEIKSNRYLVQYFKDIYGVPEGSLYEDGSVTNITFNKDNKTFAFKNNEIELNNENFDTWKNIIEDSGIWYDEFNYIRFYLDDYNQVSFKDNMIDLTATNKYHRTGDELEITYFD